MTGYESRTLEHDAGDPRHEDFWEEWYEVTDLLAPGPNAERAEDAEGHGSEAVLPGHRHFPVRVATPDGEVLYEGQA